jgi:hypothetical protein
MAEQEDRIDRTWVFAGGQPAFDFDMISRESHESEISITENPIEGGSPAHDHAVILPKRLEIEGRVSDTPLPSGGAAVFGREGRRSVTAFEMMVNLQESREVFTVLTGLRRYTNMMLKNFRTVQDAGTAEVLDFTATLQEVRIVNTEIVTFPPRRPGKTKRQGDKKTDGGEKKATDATAAQQKATHRSLALQGLDSLIKEAGSP